MGSDAGYTAPMMNTELSAVARQQLETDLLMGVDFVPRGSVKPQNHEGEEESAGQAVVPEVIVESTNKETLLDSLRQRHDRECPHCTTAEYHTQTVFGEGNPDADLMFIGEAPGAEEDRLGRPFVGRSGDKLNEIINAMGLKREKVFIANVLKSRPPENRTPLQPEVDACSPFLAEQIRIIRPTVIVTLGGPAAKLMLKTSIGITKLRGQWAEYVDESTTPPLVIPIMPTFHPAYLLRNYTPDTRKQMWSDMQMVMERIG